jgi:hypothetical protein
VSNTLIFNQKALLCIKNFCPTNRYMDTAFDFVGEFRPVGKFSLSGTIAIGRAISRIQRRNEALRA